MKKILIFVLLFLSICTVSTAQTEQELFNEGVKNFKQGNYFIAIDSFSKLIKLSPDNADAYKNRGVTYMKLDKFDLAIKDFENAKELFPELKGLYSNLGVAWYFKKEYEKAIKSYDMAIMLEPDHHVAYFNRALCLAELGKNKEALVDLAKTLELKPDVYKAICYKADILAQTGKEDQAVKIYEEAIKLKPDDAYAVEKLAQLRIKLEPKSKIEPKDDKTASIVIKNNVTKKSVTKESTHELQAGAFLNQDNAVRMKNKLISKGFDSRVLVLQDSKDRTWYLVRSGNFPDKKSAKKAIPSLNQKMSLKSVARPFGDW